MVNTSPHPSEISRENVRAKLLLGYIFAYLTKNHNIKEKKSWEPFRIWLLKSTANPAQVWWKWARLTVIFSRQLLNSSHNLFAVYSITFFLIKKITQYTFARVFS